MEDKRDILKTLRAKLSYIKRVNLISVDISNTFLKRANWKKIQLFGNSEQLLLTGKNII